MTAYDFLIFIFFCNFIIKKEVLKEEFLHYVWKYKLFSLTNLQTVSKESVHIFKEGMHNRNSGPDFLNAQIRMDHQLWIGNVEIHLKSSDWYLHHHEKDEKYDAVILHVVWEHDSAIFMKNNKPLPTLVLKNLVDKNLIHNYQQLCSHQSRWIPCESQINWVDDFTLKNWLERLFFERLERKSNFINGLLEKNHADFEAVLFCLLAKNFGLKLNGDAFLALAESIDFSIIRKEQSAEKSFTALLFGQAGFLEAVSEEEYYRELKREYEYLQHKYHLTPISKNQFQFFRIRPTNFPTIRMAQLVSLYHQHKNLFSKLISINKIDDFYTLFSVEVNEFWKTHYSFDSPSKRSLKKLSKSFIDLLIINTIIPLKFVYQMHRNQIDENELIHLIKQLKPERNSIISRFNNLHIESESAFDTQALLELKNNYCASKRCLECAIGSKILYRI
jgi:hypothetical protein